jgi:hypothetical protein
LAERNTACPGDRADEVGGGWSGETIGAAAGTSGKMSVQLGSRQIVAPDGVEWRIDRQWITGRPRPLRRRQNAGASGSLQSLGSSLPDLGGVDLGQGLLAIAAVLAVVLVLIPVLFFGLELIILGVLLAAGVMARTLLGQPWVIEARSVDPLSSGRRLEWRLRGWRRSQNLIAELAAELAAGHDLSTVRPSH